MSLHERWFRTNPDSSILDRPRLMARSLIDVADLDDHIAFYERLQGLPADLRMPIPDFGGLELAAIGGLLLIASERPFTPIQRQTAYSLIVPSLDDYLARSRTAGTAVLEPREAIVPGARARVRYPDGTIAELVEHRPRPGECPAPRRAGAQEDGTPARLLARRAVPQAEFDLAVAFYETALETRVEARAKPDVRGVSEVAIMGGLLAVALDGPDLQDRVSFALLGGSRYRAAVTLATGVRAEAWPNMFE